MLSLLVLVKTRRSECAEILPDFFSPSSSSSAVAFKEICPAGPGYHYSASALQFNQRVTEQLGGRGAPLVTHGNQDIQGTSYCTLSPV